MFIVLLIQLLLSPLFDCHHFLSFWRNKQNDGRSIEKWEVWCCKKFFHREKNTENESFNLSHHNKPEVKRKKRMFALSTDNKVGDDNEELKHFFTFQLKSLIWFESEVWT
jgi:hypothetical protein